MKERRFVRFLVYVCLFSCSPPPTFVARGDDGVGNGGVGLDVQVGQGAEDLDPLAKGAAAGQGGDHLGQACRWNRKKKKKKMKGELGLSLSGFPFFSFPLFLFFSPSARAPTPSPSSRAARHTWARPSLGRPGACPLCRPPPLSPSLSPRHSHSPLSHSPGRRGRKRAFRRTARTSPVPSDAACRAVARLEGHGSGLGGGGK